MIIERQAPEGLVPFSAIEMGEAFMLTEEYQAIEALPSIEAVPVRKGKWLEDKSLDAFWICSVCGFPSEASGANVLYKFCPNCGADMRGDVK